MSFVHLHTHSNYSLREGAAYVSDLAGAAAAMGAEALALTDHDGMYGAVRFSLACTAAGVRPILGTEVEWGPGYHATLLAADAQGWSNLCRLVTEMHLRCARVRLAPGKRPRTSFEAIARFSKGVFALSGCSRGEVASLAAAGRMEDARAAARRWLDVFGTGRFAIEVSNHLLAEDRLRIGRLTELSDQLGIRTAATNNVHYAAPQDAAVHEVLDCIRRIVPLSAATAVRKNHEYWMKPPQEMARLHSKQAVEGTAWVAEECRYTLPLGEFHFPDPMKNPEITAHGADPSLLLAAKCREGLVRRYRRPGRKITERLNYELQMIRRMGFCGYFLLVARIVDHIKHRMGIRCACRGSAAGCLVAYLLGISEVDPVSYDLVFERFMNPYRREIPDIDIDVESARREQVNNYILSAFPQLSAMAGMMETFQARAAIREVGKALGITQSEIDVLAKAFPHIAARNITAALRGFPEVAGLNLSESRLDFLFNLASRLDRFPRHLAMHPSGVILSDNTLADLMPMQLSNEGFLTSQFDKDDIEALGIAKLDVLGVRMLSSITHTLKEIERVRGQRIDLEKIDKKDPAAFKLIRESRTLGCFQIESPGQRELLGKFQPDRFEDLIVDISLFRPGPMKADMIKPFLNRRMGLEPVSYGHPSMAAFLKETHGVIVYHEQVMRVLSALSGCCLSEADQIRRRLDDAFEAADPAGGSSLAKAPAHHPLRRKIIDRAAARGWDRAVAAKIWDEVLAFASFGFCKAHAAAFAVPTFQSSWLKAHFPAEFYCGVLSHEPGMYPRRAILADARIHGVPILPCDVNLSAADYRAEPVDVSHRPGPLEALEQPPGSPLLGIRLGLQDVKGISDSETASIIAGRPFNSLEDFCLRAQVSRPVIEGLIHCGAFDSISCGRSRRELFWAIGLIQAGQERSAGEPAAARRPSRRGPRNSQSSGEQISLELFDDAAVDLQGIRDYSRREKVAAELEVTGMDVSAHVMSFYSGRLTGMGWVPAARLLEKRAKAAVVVAGVKVATQTPPIKSGKRVIFLTLDDGTGQVNIAMFDEAQQQYARTVFDGWILAVRGVVRRTGAAGVSVLGEQVWDLASEPGAPPPFPAGKIWHASGGSAG